jgi:hypothetical protein
MLILGIFKIFLLLYTNLWLLSMQPTTRQYGAHTVSEQFPMPSPLVIFWLERKSQVYLQFYEDTR